jgi:putative component of membrane protein insertase Oxa1/YidC/SpoIIIJ protein YidD
MSANIERCMKKVCSNTYVRRQKKHGVTRKLAREGCRITSCNPTCKKTSFGPDLIMSKTLRQSALYKPGEKWRKKFEKKRKRLFGTRKNILKNGFYIKIPKKEVSKARRRGEISGCHNA